jgi:hypothetical protein
LEGGLPVFALPAIALITPTYWLRWDPANFMPKLTLNNDPPDQEFKIRK